MRLDAVVTALMSLELSEQHLSHQHPTWDPALLLIIVYPSAIYQPRVRIASPTWNRQLNGLGLLWMKLWMRQKVLQIKGKYSKAGLLLVLTLQQPLSLSISFFLKGDTKALILAVEKLMSTRLRAGEGSNEHYHQTIIKNPRIGSSFAISWKENTFEPKGSLDPGWPPMATVNNRGMNIRALCDCFSFYDYVLIRLANPKMAMVQTKTTSQSTFFQTFWSHLLLFTHLMLRMSLTDQL